MILYFFSLVNAHFQLSLNITDHKHVALIRLEPFADLTNYFMLLQYSKFGVAN